MAGYLEKITDTDKTTELCCPKCGGQWHFIGKGDKYICKWCWHKCDIEDAAFAANGVNFEEYFDY